MSNKKRGPSATFFFVYRKPSTEIDIVHGVLNMDYHSEVMTVRGGIRVHGSTGIFCNTVDEAILVEKNFNELMDDDLPVEDFAPQGKEIPKEDSFVLEIEEKEIHNGIRITIETEDLSEREETPGDGEIQDPSIPM